ncbi:hypothetical protein PR202_gb25501 [Eleusine coracana subsp. coracana]|uniref:Uncharacterized protein n=1 Tax=Eleusine coracana subsp. coracana TaxID=191504 RepID=A0AAV5FLN1_ELECO|nr:hypothetical protein PR202_gb25501 [Eleusine coracana subsp. coracana]
METMVYQQPGGWIRSPIQGQPKLCNRERCRASSPQLPAAASTCASSTLPSRENAP